MVHIKIRQGLDLPLPSKPLGQPQSLILKESEALPSQAIALNLACFETVKFKILVRIGDKVKVGQQLAEDKECAGRYFVSPAGGVIREIRRGVKRQLLDIVIEVSPEEEYELHPHVDLQRVSRAELVEKLKLGGLFAHIRQRPFNLLAHPDKKPKSIFIRAVESCPFAPPPEFQIEGFEKEFECGLKALTALTDGQVHLVTRQKSIFLKLGQGAQLHTIEGPHPMANASIHIAAIDPILSAEEIVWTLSSLDVTAIGFFLMHGKYFTPRIVAVAGSGILDGKTGFFKVRAGYPIKELVADRLQKGTVRLISGSPLTGSTVTSGDFLGFDDTILSAICENSDRQFLHFFRLGADKFTFTGTYLSGHVDPAKRTYQFTTNQHGEGRPFIDGSVYDRVMPLNISTMHLVKAILAEDFDLAIELGLLEVDAEDFALPAFICPSKIELMQIVKEGLRRCATEQLK